MLESIRKSEYAEKDPTRACLFVPAVDLLNLQSVKLNEVSLILDSLKW